MGDGMGDDGCSCLMDTKLAAKCEVTHGDTGFVRVQSDACESYGSRLISPLLARA
jgi:hypothetical protein